METGRCSAPPSSHGLVLGSLENNHRLYLHRGHVARHHYINFQSHGLQTLSYSVSLIVHWNYHGSYAQQVLHQHYHNVNDAVTLTWRCGSLIVHASVDYCSICTCNFKGIWSWFNPCTVTKRVLPCLFKYYTPVFVPDKGNYIHVLLAGLR